MLLMGKGGDGGSLVDDAILRQCVPLTPRHTYCHPSPDICTACRLDIMMGKPAGKAFSILDDEPSPTEDERQVKLELMATGPDSVAVELRIE